MGLKLYGLAFHPVPTHKGGPEKVSRRPSLSSRGPHRLLGPATVKTKQPSRPASNVTGGGPRPSGERGCASPRDGTCKHESGTGCTEKQAKCPAPQKHNSTATASPDPIPPRGETRASCHRRDAGLASAQVNNAAVSGVVGSR